MGTEYTREQLREALIQTALSFYWHGRDVQYDSNCMVRPLGWTARRCDTRLTAECAAPDNYVYTVCSDFVHRSFRDAFDFYLAPGSDTYLTEQISSVPSDDPISVFRFDAVRDGEENAEQAVLDCFRLLEPGDVLCYYIDHEATATRKGIHAGHAMLYIGDYFGDGRKYILHSMDLGGGKFKYDTGIDPEEPRGSIRLQDVNQICFFPPVKRLGTYRALCKATRFVLHRPLRLVEKDGFRPTAAAQTRMRFPGLDVRKTLDRPQFSDARPGESVTVTLCVENHSHTPYTGLTIREPVPAGQKLLSVTGGGAVQGNEIVWTLSVQPGQKLEVRYAVQVCGEPGGLIRFPAGLAGEGVVTRETALKLGGRRLNARQLAALDRVASGELPACVKEPFEGMQSVNRFWQEVLGEQAGLPSEKAFAALFDSVRLPDAQTDEDVFMLRKDAQLPETLLYKHLSGQLYFGGHNMDTRVLEYRERNYLPGDVFLCVTGPWTATFANREALTVQILLGSGKVLTLTAAGAEVGNFTETVERDLRMNLLAAFRPILR